LKDFPGSTEKKSRHSMQNGGLIFQTQIWNSSNLLYQILSENACFPDEDLLIQAELNLHRLSTSTKFQVPETEACRPGETTRKECALKTGRTPAGCWALAIN
jgi:hypothetical protein